MASRSNNKGTSPSSSSVPNSPNPSGRVSEISNPLRRSFSGKPSIVANPRGGLNPNTPANSPSDVSRRNGRDNILSSREFDDKENRKEDNSKGVRARSPAPLKGTKNFMSPTISAASKMSPLPRKKTTLADENELIRTSISNHKKLDDSHDITITDLNSKVSKGILSLGDDQQDTLSEQITEEKSSVTADPSGSYSSPMRAPLDEDSSNHGDSTYDPKTNFLSPRPQFLHYKPNPRVELYLNKVKDGKQLDETFLSESSSDSEVIEEEPLPVSVDSDNFPVDVSSGGETMKEEEVVEEVEERDVLVVSESNPEVGLTTEPKDVVEDRGRVSKPCFLTKSKFITLLLVLVVACFSVTITNSPAVDPYMIPDIRVYVPPEIMDHAKAGFNRVAESFQVWSASSLSHVCNLATRIGEHQDSGPLVYGKAHLNKLADSFRVWSVKAWSYVVSRLGEKEIGALGSLRESIQVWSANIRNMVSRPGVSGPGGALQYGNSTGLLDYSLIGKRCADIELVDDSKQVIEADEFFEDNTFVDVVEEEVNQVVETEEHTETTSDEHSHLEEPNDFEVNPSLGSEESAHVEDEQATSKVVSEEIVYSEPDVVVKMIIEQQDFLKPEEYAARVDDLEQKTLMIHMDEAVDTSVTELRDVLDGEEYAARVGPLEFEEAQYDNDSSQSSEDVETMDSQGVEMKSFLMQNVVGISLLLWSLLVAVVFVYLKTVKPSARNNDVTADADPGQQLPPVNRKLEYSPVTETEENLLRERLSSKNNRRQTFDMVENNSSCPSEMSSFPKSSYVKKGTTLDDSSEAQSQERKSRRNINNNHNKRESLATSEYSMASASYGSFTTYEKIPIKHGHGDDEVITPVRRSSRLRNHQVISS